MHTWGWELLYLLQMRCWSQLFVTRSSFCAFPFLRSFRYMCWYIFVFDSWHYAWFAFPTTCLFQAPTWSCNLWLHLPATFCGTHVSVCQEELSHVNQIIGFLKWYIQPIYSPFSAWAKHSSNLHISTPIAVKIASWVSKYMEPCSCSWVFCVVRVVGESLLLLSCS